MKLLSWSAVLVIAFATLVYGDDDWHPCNTNYDCEYDECCIEDRFSNEGHKICRDRGDDPGDLCGGQFYCDCERGYICQPHPPEARNSPWLRASNGSCRYNFEAYRRRTGHYVRRIPLRRAYAYTRDWDDIDDFFDDSHEFDDSFDDDRRRRR